MRLSYLAVFCTVLFLGWTDKASAQLDMPTYDYSSKTTYNIGGLKITGAVNRDRNAIKSIAALREGKEISIPGDDIPNAIKALLRLKLFEDVKIVQEKIEGDLIFLELILEERSTLSRYSIKGENKNKHSELTDIIDNILIKGSIVTEDLKNLAKLKLKEEYMDKGFLDAEITITEKEDELKDNAVRLIFDINKRERVKISDIVILGNTKYSDAKLKRKMKETKEIGTVFKKSKFVADTYKEDKNSLVDFYNTNGFRDAVIVSDSVVRRADGHLQIFLTIDEGEQYYFRNISWKGNSKYTSEQLAQVLGIKAGDVYNPLTLENQLSFSIDGRDVSSLYLDDGYLFFSVEPTEVAVTDNAIDLEMQIYEGPQAIINNVIITGNDRTHEHVVRRELRTKPGNKFSRSHIIRSQRSLMNLGYFNPENLNPQPIPNQANGTVDILYPLEERPSDQLELSAGYGGQASGLIGTLGFTFNNFSLKNISDKSTWSPLPQGDGQKVSIRAQSNSRAFRSFNASFTEPWLGGKRPTSFTLGAVHTSFDQSIQGAGTLGITRVFAGIGTQLKWPDDFFSINTTLTTEWINLDQYRFGQFRALSPDGVFTNIENGSFKNFSLTQTITRSSVADPIYPRRGSRVSLSVQFTPPYSLLGRTTVNDITQQEKDELIRNAQEEMGSAAILSDAFIENLINGEVLARKFNFLEYHKWRFNAEWYFNIVDKFVIATNFKMGFLGRYDSSESISPFERFELGGDGLNNQAAGITGRDIIALRGYQPEDLPENNNGGAAVYDKFTVELRYPISTNPNSAIYLHTFVQGGNSWSSFREFNPFDLNRSAGFGARVFLPMFGLLGFDYGWGFDKDPNARNFEGFGQFNIILGFEPE